MRKTLTAALVAASLLTLAACGNDDGSGSAAGHNDADVAFAQQMIPHHQQAVEMAQLAETRAESAEVKNVAAEIKAAQDPEIETMTGWLESWGEDVPDEDMSGMDHGSSGKHSGDGHQQPCPFAAAPHVATPSSVAALQLRSQLAKFSPLLAAEQAAIKAATYKPQSPRAPPISV